jgi:hypothetical protein
MRHAGEGWFVPDNRMSEAMEWRPWAPDRAAGSLAAEADEATFSKIAETLERRGDRSCVREESIVIE